jgi:hypothetical protein
MGSGGPNDKFSNYVDTSLYNSPEAVLTALSDAWAAFYAAWGVYPNNIVAVGSVIYYGAYGD